MSMRARWSIAVALSVFAATPACFGFHHDDHQDGWDDEEWEDDDDDDFWGEDAGSPDASAPVDSGSPPATDAGTSVLVDAGSSGGADAGAAPTWPSCPDEAGVNTFYVSHESKVCDSVSYTCPAGLTVFRVDCGCGCTDEPPCPARNDPNVHYFGLTPEACQFFEFQCDPGCEPFSNGCGCGCIEQTSGS